MPHVRVPERQPSLPRTAKSQVRVAPKAKIAFRVPTARVPKSPWFPGLWKSQALRKPFRFASRQRPTGGRLISPYSA